MLRWPICLPAVALASGCAHSPPHHPGDERLAAVKFEGNKRFGNDALMDGLALHRVLKHGGAADPYMVQVDGDRIRGEYLRKGYLDVDVRSRIERKGDDATVTYTVEEGVRAVTRAQITGLPDDLPVAKVRALLPLKDGAPFDYEAYDLSKQGLLLVIQDAGYAHARLDASVVADRASHTAIIELAYTPGPKCKFGPVKITGVTGDLAHAVLERITFHQGELYSAHEITQTQHNLYAFGRFSTVRVQPDKDGKDVVGVEIAVSESARREVTLGGGVGIDPTSREVRGRAGYTIAGWPFPLDTVTIDLRPAYAYLIDGGGYEPRVRAVAKLERQDLLWTYSKGEVDVGYNYLTVEAYTSHGPFARLGFETRIFTPRVVLRLGWDLEQTWFRHISDVILPPLRQQLGIDHGERIGAYQQGLIVDLRDNPIEPKLGAYAEVRTAEGTPYAGSAYKFFELVPDLRVYAPLVGGAVVAAHARYGAIWGDVPPTERFFGGGAVSQRGFSERQLSPSRSRVLDPGGSPVTVPIGGAGLIETGAELRVPLTKIRTMPLGGVVFLDGGDVTDTADGLDPWNLHWALGAGIRLLTIVGPVRIDVGYRLNRTGPAEPAPGSHYAYHLTIGEAF